MIEGILLTITIFVVDFVATYYIQELVRKIDETADAVKSQVGVIGDLEDRVEELEEKLKAKK